MGNLLNTKETADKLKISTRRVRSLIEEGKLPAQKVGRDYIIDETNLANVTIYGKQGRPPKTAKR